MIKELRDKIQKREISIKEVVSSYLSKKDEWNCFLNYNQQAIQQAEEMDKMDNLPELAGIPFAVKDNIMVKGLPCTASSKILKNYQAVYEATVVEKLKKAGAIVLGKTNLDEFAMGSSTEYSSFGVTKNPFDPERVAGGSSGGSAAAVASDLAVFALGSDTGGSIRQPASFCGVVGMRPTYGYLSRYGMMALASSMDQIGPLTKNSEDALIVLRAMKGKDIKDSTSQDFVSNLSTKRIGVIKECFNDSLDPRIKELIEKRIPKAKELSMSYNEYALPCYSVLTSSEASTNMARYDGLRYGELIKGDNLEETYIKTRTQLLGPEVQRRIVLGINALREKKYYEQANRVRSLIKNDFTKLFQEVDFIVTPTSPFLPFKIGERDKDSVNMYLADLLTVTAGLTGIPAVSIPCGFIDGLPVGLQVMAPVGQDEALLKFCMELENIWKS
jgi:aspartyl-tRNA(Asn)/glutamyl-tRNA(Gln) amidotransferase subunit A